MWHLEDGFIHQSLLYYERPSVFHRLVETFQPTRKYSSNTKSLTLMIMANFLASFKTGVLNAVAVCVKHAPKRPILFAAGERPS